MAIDFFIQLLPVAIGAEDHPVLLGGNAGRLLCSGTSHGLCQAVKGMRLFSPSFVSIFISWGYTAASAADVQSIRSFPYLGIRLDGQRQRAAFL